MMSTQRTQLPPTADALLAEIHSLSPSIQTSVICNNFACIVKELILQSKSEDIAEVTACMNVKGNKFGGIVFRRPFRTSYPARSAVTDILMCSKSYDLDLLKSVFLEYMAITKKENVIETAVFFIEVLDWLTSSHGSIRIPIANGRIDQANVTVKEFLN